MGRDFRKPGSFILGGEGDDQLTGSKRGDIILGEGGTDTLTGGRGRDALFGGAGVDTLNGDKGRDLLVGGPGQDELFGGAGRDLFLFAGDAFAEGAPVPVGTTGIAALNLPDNLRDFQIDRDKFVFNGEDFGVDTIDFVKGTTAEIEESGNVIVQLDPFVNAASAAAAIAANDAITADEGFFVYFNTTLGIHRLVYSEDLGDGGDISVLANLNGQTDVADLAKFDANDFLLV